MSCSDERRGLNQKRGMRKTERGRRWRRQKQGIRRAKSTAVDFANQKCFQGTKKPPSMGRWIAESMMDPVAIVNADQYSDFISIVLHSP